MNLFLVQRFTSC